mgnify:CR=1 FL=1
MKTSDNRWSGKFRSYISPERLGAALWPVLTVVPLLAGIGYAVLYSLGGVGLLSEGWTLQHWREALTDLHLLKSFAYSIYVGILSIVTSISLALCGTLVFRSQVGRRWTGMLLYAPLAIPSVVTAFFVYEIFAQSGWLSRVLHQLGLLGSADQFPILIQDPWAIGIITAHVAMAAPFFLILFLNTYQNEQIDELRRVASTLGAGSLESDWKITIPVLFHRSYPTIVLYFIFAVGSYEIPLLLGASSPQMLAVNVVRNLQRFSLDTIPHAYILALLYVVVVIGILWALLRRKKLFYEA